MLENKKEKLKDLFDKYEISQAYSSPPIIKLNGGAWDVTVISPLFDFENGLENCKDTICGFLLDINKYINDGLTKFDFVGKKQAAINIDEYGEKGMANEGKTKIFENGIFLV